MEMVRFERTGNGLFNMALEKLQKTLQEAASGGTLTLTQISEESFVFTLVSNQIPFSEMSLTGVTVSPLAAEKFTVGGKGKWGLLEGVEAIVSFHGETDTIADLLLKMPPSFSLSIPNVDWFSLNQVALEITSAPAKIRRNPLYYPTSGAVRAVVTVKNVSLPIKIGLTPAGEWLVEGDFSSIDFPSLSDILSFVGKSDDVHLPDSLNNLTKIALYDVALGFNPTTKKVSFIGVTIGSSPQIVTGWEILPGVFTINSYRITVNVTNPTVPQSRAVGGSIAAKLTLGGTDIELYAGHPSTGGWDFRGVIGKEHPVRIGDLVLDLGNHFNVTLPAALHEFTLKDFEFAFNTQSGKASGKFTVDFEIERTAIELTLTADLEKGKKSVTGLLYIGTSKFDVAFKDDTSKTFTAKWSDKNPLTFADIANKFGWTDMPPMPERLDLALTDAEFFYDFDAKSMVLSAHSQHYGQIVFATFVPQNGARVYLFELDVPLNVELSDLPLIGPQLPSSAKLGIKNLEVIISSGQLGQVSELNTLLAKVGDSPLIPKTLNAGLTFAANIELGSDQQPFVLPLTSDKKPAPLQPLASTPSGDNRLAPLKPAAAPPSYNADATWFEIGKTLGPVSFKRIGVEYQNSKLFFLLDASLDFSGLTIAADGLGLGSPLTKFEPEPHLDGVSLSFSSGPLTIDGGFLVVPPPLPPGVTEEYMGEVVIAFKPFLISGVAAYAKVDGNPSVFVFAQIKGEFGGPPAFFISGFMGGFGYNSQLNLPEFDQLYTFPFIAGLDDPTIFGNAKPTPLDVLRAFSGGGGKKAWITPTTGENWIAAGVMFRSFELVLGRVLLIVSFGKEFEIALLGLASMSLPQGATAADAYAYVELQLEALLKPAEGSFSIIASLTENSYLLSKDCHLTGGFGFCVWFGPNKHAGDFVITIGGYHPAFSPPLWYPKVPQVGFNWVVGGGVTVKGGAYFALTPTAVMAGGSLEVLYQSDDLRAWFTAYANLMIRWKPFYFTAGIGISLGASFRLNLLVTSVTITVEVGASLDLWGPPTGGVVHIHLWIFSFSVAFGAEPLHPEDLILKWDGFKSLLPSTSAGKSPSPAMLTSETSASKPVLLNVNINGGLLRQDATGMWIVRADELVFTTQSAIPTSSLKITNKSLSLPDGAPSTINIRPMGLQGVKSEHSVTLTYLDENKDIDLATWPTPATQTANLPEALWGAPLKDKEKPAPAAETIRGLPTGLTFTTPPATAGAAIGPVDPSSLVDELGGGYMPLHPAQQSDAIPAPVVDANSITEIMSTLASQATLQAQQALVTALKGFAAAPPSSAPLAELAKRAGSLFSEAPLRAADRSN
jgi:hypothetical protein